MGFHYRDALRRFRSFFGGGKNAALNRPVRSRGIETLEARRVMSADPIRLGAIYHEEDGAGGDDHGDTFIVTFEGGADGTQLTRLIFDGDQIENFGNLPGLSTGDMIFDITPGGLGADAAFPFQIVSANGIDSITATVTDGGSRLILDFVGFDAGEELKFSIDVDEVIIYDPNNPGETLIDPIASGAEFHGTLLTGEFSAAHYEDATINTKFYDMYDAQLAQSGLDLPADNSTGHRDRTDGAFGSIVQEPLPITISGTVYHDPNLSLTQDVGEEGIAGVSLTLWKKENGVFVNTGHTVTTDANGNYLFGEELGLQPGTYQVREAQPTGYFSVGAVPGTVQGSPTGSTVSGDPDILTEITIPLGGTSAVDYDFAEATPAMIDGYVYHDRDNDGVKEAGEEGIGGVQIRVQGVDVLGNPQSFLVTTDANGYYKVTNMPPGVYEVLEVVQPPTYQDGKDTAGTVNGVTKGVANNPGDRISTITLKGGDSGINYNFGEIRPAEIRGHVHLTDPEGNCFGEGIETTPIEGAVINLYDDQGNLVATTTTDANGEYFFGNLLPGTYTIEEITPPGLIDGGDHVGTIDGIKVGNLDGNDRIADIELLSGDSGVHYDFCEHLPASLSGYVYHDRNNNGIREAGEEGIEGVLVQLYDENNIPAGLAITDANGFYEFVGLSKGQYHLAEIQPFEYIDGLDTAGTIFGTTVGAAVNPGDEINTIDVKWGDEGIEYNFGEIKHGSLSGYVYHDRNINGTKNDGEEGIANVTITLINTDTNETFFTTTDDNGYYEFLNLVPGNYRVVETHPIAYQDGTDQAGTINGSVRGVAVNPGDEINSITIGSDEHGINYNFGEYLYASISGTVRLTDEDGNCDFNEATERPVVGAEIHLYDSNGNLLKSTVTDANGDYFFGELLPGSYTIVEVTPPGLIDGGDHIGTIDGILVGNLGGNDRIESIVLMAGQHGENYDFCESEPADLSGYVYHDRNNNGVREAGEEGIGGTTVQLFDENGNLVDTLVTNDNGYYHFTGLTKGTYRIVETQPTGYLDGKDIAGTINGTTVGAATNPGDVIHTIDLKFGQSGIEYDFGEVLPTSIGGFVHVDPDQDCIFDDDEQPISGVKITLLDENGNEIATTFTDANGHYQFDGLPPGNYTVVESQPAGYFQGGQIDHNGLADASVTDVISNIVTHSGEHLDEHNFCELPPAALSGYVFQDGAVISNATGEVPADIASLRDGQRTADDTPLAGVVLELRDGFSGEPILGSSDSVLQGLYGNGPIRVVTDANGYYRFDGLKTGFYAVYQVHPDGYIDSIDTVGTTGGLAVNPGTIGPEVSALSIDPGHDAIIRIFVVGGTESLENNFSEIRVEPFIPPPEIPPAIPPVTPPPVAVPPPTPELIPPAQLLALPQIVQPFGGSAVGFTWHLSVVNAGDPRGKEPVATSEAFWLTSANGDINPWNTENLGQASWTLLADGEDGEESEMLQRLFGSKDAIPVAGDFNGDGVSELGVFIDGHWFIDLNGNGRWDDDDMYAKLGHDGDQPVVGDWDGDGKDDIGIYGKAWPNDPRAVKEDPGLPDAANHFVSLDKAKNVPPKEEHAPHGTRVMKVAQHGKFRQDLIDHTFHFGVGGDHALVGDWNGDGISTIAVFRSGTWHIDSDGDGRWNPEVDAAFAYGEAGDLPVVGDWNGDGIDEIGVYRGGEWIVDDNGNHVMEPTDKVFQLGDWDDIPTVGDWDGNGTDDPGVFHANQEEGSVTVASRKAG
ncbi:SdrD B-like domain-containing protein [Bremerella sp. JC770]|uniref:SdrD B-like domain-containing protein n=1 Tax=Bremerella sp. JC770 TaxID=3232137 RepID=UPI0034585E54